MSADTLATEIPHVTSLLCSVIESCRPDTKYSPIFIGTSAAESPYSSFRSRLRTYKPSWWSSKPTHWSPWHCARYGWVCVEKDLLQCHQCHNYLSSHVPAINNLSVYHKCADKFHKSVVESHASLCSFRSTPTDLAHCTPDTSDRTTALESLLSRYYEIDKMLNSFQCDVQFLPFRALPISEEELRTLSDICDIDSMSTKALLMSLFGWSCSPDLDDRTGPTIFCDQCNRSIGLWLFCKAADVKDADLTSSSAPKTKKFRADNNRQFSPESQHYFWCPWLQKIDNLSTMHISGQENVNDDNFNIPRWRALLILLLKPVEMDYKDDKALVLEHYVLAKSLLDQAINKIELSERGITQ